MIPNGPKSLAHCFIFLLLLWPLSPNWAFDINNVDCRFSNLLIIFHGLDGQKLDAFFSIHPCESFPHLRSQPLSRSSLYNFHFLWKNSKRYSTSAILLPRFRTYHNNGCLEDCSLFKWLNQNLSGNAENFQDIQSVWHICS